MSETLRTLAMVGAAVGGGEAIYTSAAQAMPETPAMIHALTPSEQTRYQHSNGMLELGGKTVRLTMATNAVAEAAAVNPWTRYGGDPLFPGGVHSPVQFAQELLSPLGQEALRDDGLSRAEIKAVDQATHEGKQHLVHRPFGTVEPKMTFGVAQVITEPNAKFLDPRYPNGFDAYSVEGKVVTHMTVKEKVHGKWVQVRETLTDKVTIDLPTVCANVALHAREHSIVKKIIHPKRNKQKKGQIFVEKIAVDSNGDLFSKAHGDPLQSFFDGEFQGELICTDGNKKVDTKFVLEHNPQLIAECNANNPKEPATLIEGPAVNHPEDWINITPAKQSFIVSIGKQIKKWKDKEKGATSPPPVDVCANIPGNQPTVPAGDTVDQNGNCVPIPTQPTPTQTLTFTAENQPTEGGFIDQQQPQVDCFKWNLSPQDGTPTFTVTDNYGDTLSAPFADTNGDPNSECVNDNPPAKPENGQQVKMTVTYTSKILGGQVLTASATTDPYPWRPPQF